MESCSEVFPVSCKGARRQMVLADSLTAEETDMLQEHLRRCPACARQWQQWERLRALLANLPKVTASSEDRRQLMAHLMQSPLSPAPVWDCVTTRRYLWLWLDGELSKEQRFSLIAHLADCDRCQAALWESEQTLQLLRTLPKVTATAAEKAALKAKLFRQPTRKTVMPFVWRIAAPFAAAAIVMLLVMTYQFTKPSTRLIVDKLTPSAPSAPRFAQESQIKPPLPIQQPKERPIVERLTEQQKRMPEKRLKERPMTLKLAVAPTVKPYPTKREPSATQQKVKPVRVFSSPPSTPQPMPAQPLTEVLTPPTLPEPTVAIPSPPPIKPSLPQVPVPSEPTVVATIPSPSLPSPQLEPPSPIPSSMESEPRRLVSLPPISIERDEAPLPRLQLSVIPPSQQLYRKFGVALTTVPTDKNRPPRVNKPLSQEASIPLAAERYRSRTALISLWQIGIPW